jgi:hypothetical protein
LSAHGEKMTAPGRQSGAALGLALALAGCSADTALFRADWSWWSGGKDSASLSFAGAPAEGLVASDGNCAADPNQPARGIGLGMTECDLIRLAGPTGKVEIGANERGQRTAVVTYPQGEHAGIYRFTSGLLVSVERAPEPPAPRKPQRAAPRSRPPS